MITTDFTKNFQIELITNIYHNSELLEFACAYLKVEDFDLPTCKLVYSALLGYKEKYKKVPNFTVLTMEVGNKLEHPNEADVQLLPEEIESLGIVLERIAAARDLDSAYFLSKLPDYIKHTRTLKVMAENSGSVDVQNLIRQMSDLDKLNITQVQFKFDSPSENPENIMTDDAALKVSVGVASLDYKLARGLQPTQIGMITACSGVGKTNTLLNFARGAVAQGNRALFITLELKGDRIKRRYNGILGCIRAGLFQIPTYKWPEADKAKFDYVTNSKFIYADKMTILDFSCNSATVNDIEPSIIAWKEHVRKRCGDAEADRCNSVYIDWLDKIQPTGRQQYEKSHEYLKHITEDIGAIARRTDVAIWTATQGKAEADGAVKLTGKHVAWSYHKLNALDVAIGVAPVDNLANDEDMQDVVDISQIKDCSKILNYNIHKNRDAPEGDVTLYLGPPLRLFNNQQEWLNLQNNLKNGALEVLGAYST